MAYDDFQIKAEHQLVERLAMTSYGFSNKDQKCIMQISTSKLNSFCSQMVLKSQNITYVFYTKKYILTMQCWIDCRKIHFHSNQLSSHTVPTCRCFIFSFSWILLWLYENYEIILSYTSMQNRNAHVSSNERRERQPHVVFRNFPQSGTMHSELGTNTIECNTPFS